MNAGNPRRILGWVCALRITVAAALCGGFVVSDRVAAQSATTLAAVKSAVKQEFPGLRTPGLSVAVAVSNKVCWSAGFGFADLETRRPASGTTVYRFASISKPITATAIMQLVERGKVSLTAPIQKFVPTFPEKPEGAITVRHLLTHTSGIRHYRGTEFLSNRRYVTIEAALGIFQDDALEFKPGAKYQYSSHAYNILAAVVEGSSVRSFRDYLRREIFVPAGMAADLEFLELPLTERCRQYVRVGEQFLPAPAVDLSCKWAGGGMAGTAADLVRFCIALDEGKLLRARTLAQMFEPAQLTDGSRTTYGLGWQILRDSRRRTWTAHSGGAVGGTTYLLHHPDGRVAIALLANSQEVKGLRELAMRLGEMLLTSP